MLPFPAPVNFLTPDLSRVAEIEQGDWRAINDGEYCWSAAVYFEIRDQCPDVAISTECDPAGINIGHRRTVERFRSRADCFFVSCEADWPRLAWAHFHIVQNKLQSRGRDTAWIPLWPQRDLKPRLRSDANIRNVGYFGRVDDAQRFEEFKAMMAEAGFSFVTPPPHDWNDYSEVDAVVSLRFLAERRVRKKPPTKLINAWLAGAPFVAMREPAFRQIGRPGLSFLEAESMEGVLEQLLRLRNEPGLYDAVVAAGRSAVLDYDREATARRWMDVLSGPVARRYREWRRRPTLERARLRALQAAEQASNSARAVLSGMKG